MDAAVARGALSQVMIKTRENRPGHGMTPTLVNGGKIWLLLQWEEPCRTRQPIERNRAALN